LFPLHCASEQQLPGTQALPFPPGQQMSPGLAHGEATVVQALETHVLLVVLQIVDTPYVASFWQSASVLQPPQNCGVTRPQIPPLQSESAWQFPGMQAPALQM